MKALRKIGKILLIVLIAVLAIPVLLLVGAILLLLSPIPVGVRFRYHGEVSLRLIVAFFHKQLLPKKPLTRKQLAKAEAKKAAKKAKKEKKAAQKAEQEKKRKAHSLIARPEPETPTPKKPLRDKLEGLIPWAKLGVRFVGEFRYVSYQSPNVWHNSTYVCMKLAALVTIWYYFKLAEHYKKGLTAKEWVTFMLLNVLCTGIKPSFLLAFSPIMGLFLLIDLIRKVPILKILLFGSALLPSGLVILWQNAVLFGEDTGNGFGFQPWYSFSLFSLHAAIPKLAVVCSALFCVLVVAATIWKDYQDCNYLFLLCMTALGFLEALCLVENGSRSVDGNFLWGYGFCLFMLFTICSVKCWGYGFCLFMLFTICSVKCLAMKQEKAWLFVKMACVCVYGWHLWCGLYFFIRLVAGEGFFMR